MYSRWFSNASESRTRTSEKPFCQMGAFRPNSFPARNAKTAFHKLDSPFDGHVRTNGDQEMEMVGHHHERMKPKFSSCSVGVKRSDK